MRVDHFEITRAARRARAEAIGELIATGFAWLVSHLRHRPSHAARPHFAR